MRHPVETDLGVYAERLKEAWRVLHKGAGTTEPWPECRIRIMTRRQMESEVQWLRNLVDDKDTLVEHLQRTIRVREAEVAGLVRRQHDLMDRLESMAA